MGRGLVGGLMAAALAGAFCIVGCGAASGEGTPMPEDDGADTSETTSPPDAGTTKKDAAAHASSTDAGTGADANVDPTPPGGDTCVDNDDPGSAENVAKQLPETDDCDNNEKTVKGVMNGAVDVDVYKVTGIDKFGCLTDTIFESPTAGIELCVFARCRNSTADAVTGCVAGTQTTSSIGMKGCCAAAPGQATPEWDCSGLKDNDSADFVVRVKQLNGDKCLPYSFAYRY